MIELVNTGRERCAVVGVTTRSATKSAVDESLDELELLADTAGADVIARVFQDRARFEPATFIGKGKVEELRQLVLNEKIPLVIFDDDLSAVQVRNLEKSLECKVIDRSALILDIFAARAKTNEAQCQVELAQLQYLLPRLTRQWTHLSKQYGGIGTKGPGETQIETDRRRIKTRIGHLKEKLARISQQRITQRKGRSRHTRAALVGYTNVGKSTLLNLLSSSDLFVEDRLFATLDPTTRFVQLSVGMDILMTDTVGFIRKLPHHLVASFKSTLEEITEADLLLHVVDISNRNYEDQIHTVDETLHDIGAGDKTTLMVFNKIDRLEDRSMLTAAAAHHPNHIFISATRGINILGFKDAIASLLKNEFLEKEVRVRQTDQRLISQLYDLGEVLDQSYAEDAIILKLRIPKKDSARVLQMIKDRREK